MKSILTLFKILFGIGAFLMALVIGFGMFATSRPAKEISPEVRQRIAERDAKRAAEAAERKRAQFEERMKQYGPVLQDYARAHPETEKYWDLAKARQVQIGMPQELVEIAWGKPDRVNDTIYSRGKHSQWVYRDGSQYVYFEDGICTSIQSSR